MIGRGRWSGLILGAVLAFALCPCAALAAGADCHVEGAQILYKWYGVAGKTYSYDGWDAFKHVSSAYAEYEFGQSDWNYVEAGLEAPANDYATAFVAYENYSDTPKYDDHSGQVKVTGYLQPEKSWIYFEINNHTIGGSNWYAAVGGQTLLRGLSLWKPDYVPPVSRVACTQTRLRTVGERWFGTGDDNRTSTAYLVMKDANGNWFNWSSPATASDDPVWEAWKVSNTYWYARLR